MNIKRLFLKVRALLGDPCANDSVYGQPLNMKVWKVKGYKMSLIKGVKKT